jgi:two-component system phosphate regulon response regulator PhoB
MAFELIQIIEDEPEHAHLIDYALRYALYQTNIAYDGTTGVREVKRLGPALVVLDVMLPELDGYGVCRLLRKTPETSGIPILMISALGLSIHRTAGLAVGADEYLTKPFSLRELVRRVTALLERGRAKQFTNETPHKRNFGDR